MQYIKPTQKDNEIQEGIISDSEEVFDLDLKDSEIIALIDKKISESEAHWNGIKLSDIRKKNLDYWMGNQIDKSRLYNHQVPYVDNRIFPSVETIVSMVNARIPSPEVFPDQNTITSNILAKDVEKGLMAYAENNRVDVAFQFATRHLLLDRIGWLKLRWDDNVGKFGDIVTEYVLPEDIIVSKDAKPGTNPEFIAQNLKATVQELLDRFPAKAEEIKKTYSIVRGTTSQLGKLVGYREVWFTYYENGKPQEGVCWKVDKLVLGKIKNPNWNYGGNKDENKNFLNSQVKPYVAINYLNTGRFFIDDTSVVEQAIPMQDIVNKRGRQIVENADSANSGWVISTDALSVDDATSLIGDPDEKIMVKSDDVRTAVTRYPAPSLPNYVMEDKYDARNEIDNIFATNKVARGQESGNKTLGQDQIQVSQDMSRQNQIVRAIDDAADRYFRLLLQMMKVYYTKDHWFMINGRNGQFDSVCLRADIIKDGMDLRIKAGSSLPLDKVSEKEMYMDLANKGILDPLTLMEELGIPDAKDKLERLVQWSMDPMSLLQMVGKESFEREAFMDIQILNRNVVAPPTEEVTPEHLEYHNEYIKTGAFRALKNDIKEKHVNHIALEAEELRKTLQLEETKLPTAEETQAGNDMMAKADQMMPQEPQMPGQEQNPNQPVPQEAPVNEEPPVKEEENASQAETPMV